MHKDFLYSDTVFDSPICSSVRDLSKQSPEVSLEKSCDTVEQKKGIKQGTYLLHQQAFFLSEMY